MQRQSQLIRIEAPIGGWNTRDSLDNVPPGDALSLINWIPDLGELRTRPGYTEHCDIEELTTGSDKIANGGFESAGGGGADVFANWTEAITGSATITRSDVQANDGTYSCALEGESANVASVSQSFVVTASTNYKLTFYAYPSAVAAGLIRYSIYDNTNAAAIAGITEVASPAADVWQEVIVDFTTPVGCISASVTLYSTSAVVPGGGSYITTYYDDVSVYKYREGSHVETLATYEQGTLNYLIAAESGYFYDVSTAGSPVDITGTSGPFTVDRWQSVNFDGKIGFVNGTDDPQQWNGSGVMTDLTLSGSGLTDTSVIGCYAFKGRTWWWMKSSQDVWYSALNTLGGALTKFPLSRVGQFGGNLTAMTTWSHDGGSGPDDYAVFIMSSGEAIIYQGSSPAVGGDWALVGVFSIGEPLSVRGVAKYGGDVIAITKLDYVNLARVLPGVEADTNKSKVVWALRDAIGTCGSLWGWEAVVYPKRQLAIFNVPVVENTTYIQHVMNTVTGAWCKWTGVDANTWRVYKGRLFFGGADGKIYEFDVGNSDDGAAIESEMQTAWLPIGGYGNKMFTAVREFIRVNKDINTVNQFATDYQDFESQQYPVAVTSDTAAWGDPWGTPWTSKDDVYKEWQTVGVYGETVSLRKRLSTKQRVRYLGASWLFRPGERL